MTFWNYFLDPACGINLQRARLVWQPEHRHQNWVGPFNWQDKRRSVIQEVLARKPRVVIASPPCTMYSALMRLWGFQRMSPAMKRARMAAADRLFGFAIEVIHLQLGAGRGFILEHPATATSWIKPAILKLLSKPTVQLASFDQCRFGLCSPGFQKAIKKRTKLLHNIPSVHATFNGVSCKCLEVPKGHGPAGNEGKHRRIEGSAAGWSMSRWARNYPGPMVDALARAIFTAVRQGN